MTQKRWDGSTYVDLTIKKRWDGAAWVNLTIMKRWDGTAWQDIPGTGGGGAFSVTANRANITGTAYLTSGYPLFYTVYTSSTVTVSAVGGTGPYTYQWVHESGSSAVQVESPNSAITRFFANVGRHQQVAATKKCIVTDSLGATSSVLVGGILAYTTDL